MKMLPNLLVVGWALLVLGSLFLTYMMPAGTNRVERAWDRMGLSIARRDPRGSQLWWYGWGPLIGSIFIAAFAGLAALSAQFL